MILVGPDSGIDELCNLVITWLSIEQTLMAAINGRNDLASDESRYVTGQQLFIDTGAGEEPADLAWLPNRDLLVASILPTEGEPEGKNTL